MQVRRFLVHVQMRRKYMQVWVPSLEIRHKLHQDILCNLPLPVFGVHVILITNLEDNLME